MNNTGKGVGSAVKKTFLEFPAERDHGSNEARRALLEGEGMTDHLNSLSSGLDVD